MTQKKDTHYNGFEQGPIRPPSEANSLLIRVTRNCPWNHCTFCPVYKNTHFSIRPVDHVIKDIDQVYKHIYQMKQMTNQDGNIPDNRLNDYLQTLSSADESSFYAAFNWYKNDMASVFIQDANSLIIKPDDMIHILNHLKTCFPEIKRITSYARSQTISKIKQEKLNAIKESGLDRIHIGLESGSDEVLKRVKKGVSKEAHINAGLKVKKAGMELSEYVMPGLGGQQLSELHAKETADAINQINPDFIRLRTLAIPTMVPLWEEYQSGKFDKCTDIMMVREILMFIDSLQSVTSTIASDHTLNLFHEIRGKLPKDQPKLTGVLNEFLNLSPEQQMWVQVGQRLGIIRYLAQIHDVQKITQIKAICQNMGITTNNVDQVIEHIMRQFI